MMKKVTIKGKEYVFRYGWGALYLYEVATGGKVFDAKSTAALHLMIFCVLANANGDKWNLTQDEFVEALDTEKGLASKLSGMFTAEMERWAAVQEGDAGPAGEEKKSD